MKRLFFILTVAILTGVLVSCEKDDDLFIQQEEVQVEKSQSMLKSTGKSYANYGNESAAQYALAHCGLSGYPYNSFYVVFSPNDCANFVSQSLYSGGLRPDVDNIWWYDFYGQYTNPYDKATYAWRSVSGLYSYLKANYYTKEYSITTLAEYNAYKKEAQIGDLVFSMEAASHAMIITNIVKSGSTITDVQYSGHTIDRRNKTLYYVWNNLPTWASFKVIRLL